MSTNRVRPTLSPKFETETLRPPEAAQMSKHINQESKLLSPTNKEESMKKSVPIAGKKQSEQPHSSPSSPSPVKKIPEFLDNQGVQETSSLASSLSIDQTSRTPAHGYEQPVEQAWFRSRYSKPLSRWVLLECAKQFPWFPKNWDLSYKGTLLNGAALKARFDRLAAQGGVKVNFTELPTAANQFKKPVVLEYFY